MSFLRVEPDKTTWQYELNPFTITVQAYGDDNRRISNKQLYVIYDIRTDGSTPDISSDSAVKKYSDKDGIIEIPVYEKCRVSLEMHRVTVQDDTIDPSREAPPDRYISETICNNVLLPFQPFVTSFSAIYDSNEAVSVTDEIPLKFIKTTFLYSNGENIISNVGRDEEHFTLSNTVVSVIGENIINVTFHDDVLEKDWTCDIIVIGKIKERELFAMYIADAQYTDGTVRQKPIKEILDIIQKSEVMVRLTGFDGVNETTRWLDSYEWEFGEYPQITNANNGIFTIHHNDLKCQVRIPYKFLLSDYVLDAWYEGEPVELETSYDSENLRIYLYNTKKDKTIMLDPMSCKVTPEDTICHKIGWNWFTVYYTIEGFTLSDKVAIFCRKEKEREPHDFKMQYWDFLTHSLIDVTEIFEDCTKINERRFFNWFKIHDRIKEKMLYGFYLLTAPVLSGLDTKSDTEWIIECQNKRAMQCELNKVLN